MVDQHWLGAILLLAVLVPAHTADSIASLQVQQQQQRPASSQPIPPSNLPEQSPAPSPAPSPTSNEEQDVDALRMLQQGSRNFATLQGDQIQGWLDVSGDVSSDPCQGWTGVTCNPDSGRVIKLELPNLGIETRLPPELALLTDLVVLNLTGNNLSGGIPSNWGQDSAFGRLKVLDLSKNPNLSGALPPSWGTQGSFVSLETLRLDLTGVSGQLPLAWASQGSLPNLTYLNLSSNILGGEIPVGWGTVDAFSALKILDLSNNTFSGEVPLQWGIQSTFGDFFPSLQSLDLSSNNLSEYLPSSWGTGFQALKKLDLHNNFLSGNVPEEWADSDHWQNMSYMSLSSNSLSGPVPLSWQTFFERENLTMTLFPGNAELCAELSYTMWAAINSSPNRQTRMSGSSCLVPPLQASPVAPMPAPARLPPAQLPPASLPPAPAPRLVLPLAPAPTPGVPPPLAPAPTPGVPAPLAPAPTPGAPPPLAPAPTPGALAPRPAPAQSPAVAPAPVPNVESPIPTTVLTPMPAPLREPLTPTPEPQAAPAPAPVEVPAPAPQEQPDLEVPAPQEQIAAPLVEVPAPSEGESPSPLGSPQSPGPSPEGLAQVTARYNLTGPGLYPANQTVRDILTSAMSQTLGDGSAVSLESVLPLQTSRRKLLQISEGIQATYVINSTDRLAPSVVETLNTNDTSDNYREQLYSQGLQAEPVLADTSILPILTSTDLNPASAPSIQPPTPPSVIPVPSSDSSGLSGGAIGGIVAGAIAGLLLIAVLGWCCWGRMNGKGRKGKVGKADTGKQIDVEAGTWGSPKRLWRFGGAKADQTGVAGVVKSNDVRDDESTHKSADVKESTAVDTFDRFESEDRFNQMDGPKLSASKDNLSVAEHSLTPPTSAFTHSSSDPSPGTSVSDHTAMISEIIPDSGHGTTSLSKPQRTVTFKDVEVDNLTHHNRRHSRGYNQAPMRSRHSDPVSVERDMVAAGAFSRRHLSGETAVRQSTRPASTEPKRPEKRKYEGHEIVGGGGGYVRRATDEKAPSSYHRRQAFSPAKLTHIRTPSGSGTLQRNNSSHTSQPSRQSSAALPSRPSSTALPRTASGIAVLNRLDKELESGLARRLSGQGSAGLGQQRSRELGSSKEAATSQDDSLAAAHEPISSQGQLPSKHQSTGWERGVSHSTSYLAAHAPAGSGGGQLRPQRRAERETNEGRRKPLTFKRRENELSQLVLHSFEADCIKADQVKRLIELSVAKLLSLNKRLMHEEAALGMSPEMNKLLVFSDQCLKALQGLLPVQTEDHLALLRRTAKMVEDIVDRPARS